MEGCLGRAQAGGQAQSAALTHLWALSPPSSYLSAPASQKARISAPAESLSKTTCASLQPCRYTAPPKNKHASAPMKPPCQPIQCMTNRQTLGSRDGSHLKHILAIACSQHKQGHIRVGPVLKVTSECLQRHASGCETRKAIQNRLEQLPSRPANDGHRQTPSTHRQVG